MVYTGVTEAVRTTPSGIDEVGCVFDAGIKTGVIKARGSHYYLGEGDENKLGQGREKVIEMLKGDEAKLRYKFQKF